jgi:histidinol-phosphate aminotransferase
LLISYGKLAKFKPTNTGFMQRRQLLKESAFAMLSFSMARDLIAAPLSLNTGLPCTENGLPIILRANENPHGPSPLAKTAMQEAVAISNRYQWDMNGLLRERIAKLTNHSRDHITLGAGSSELLGLVCLWASYQKGHVIASEPTFKLWMPAARKMGLATQLIPLTPTKHNDLERMLASINNETRLVYLCNPNNPTGTAHDKKTLEKFIDQACKSCVVLVDEAYTDYYDTASLAHMVNQQPNLIIAKTFSKVYGMAGARVGYLLAQPSLIRSLNELQAWANAGPSAVSMRGALAAMDDHAFVAFCKAENHKAKEIFCNGLTDLTIPFIPSVTSFVYFDGAAYSKPIPNFLQSHQIVGARSFEEKSTWLRLSVGTTEEMKRVVEVLKTGR